MSRRVARRPCQGMSVYWKNERRLPVTLINRRHPTEPRTPQRPESTLQRHRGRSEAAVQN